MKQLLVLFLFIGNSILAQENSIDLNYCYDQMMKNYPVAGEAEIYSSISDLKLKNIKSGWLPQSEFKAQATYQSDVIDIDIDIPFGGIEIPQPDKDQYRAVLEINQLIYDWGRIKAAKQLENAGLKINQQNTKIELNKLKEQINKFYFAILILQKNEELMKIMRDEIDQKQKTVESGVKNGVLLPSDLNVLKAEKLKLIQNIDQLAHQRIAAINVLEEITGIEMDENTVLKIPDYDLNETSGLSRPEHELFDLQKGKIDFAIKSQSKLNKPMVYAFSQLGYGKPGLNMLNDEFDSYYYLGFGVSWEFWDWKKNQRQQQVLALNKDLIQAKNETFDKQLNMALQNEMASINHYQKALQSDLDIIELRKEVTENARSKLDNGVINSTEFLTELNSETQAKIHYETNKIKLVQSIVNYLYIKGDI